MSPRGGRRARTRCLLVTPATKFGSWAWLDKVVRASGEDVEWLVVSYGKPSEPPPNARFVSLPTMDYARIGRTLSARPMLALNVLYYVPLLFVAWIAGLRFRPQVAIGNGVASTMIVSPFRLLDSRVLLAFHGYLGHAGQPWRTLLRAGLRATDRAFVNSAGSAHDLGELFPADRIVTVLHWADDRFFATPLERTPRERLRVLFVGRLDGEKFAQCLRVCRTLAREGVVELWTVGGGALDPGLRHAGIEALGYVDDLDDLASIFATADVVWAPADTTYLSLPGIEGSRRDARLSYPTSPRSMSVQGSACACRDTRDTASRRGRRRYRRYGSPCSSPPVGGGRHLATHTRALQSLR